MTNYQNQKEYLCGMASGRSHNLDVAASENLFDWIAEHFGRPLGGTEVRRAKTRIYNPNHHDILMSLSPYCLNYPGYGPDMPNTDSLPQFDHVVAFKRCIITCPYPEWKPGKLPFDGLCVAQFKEHLWNDSVYVYGIFFDEDMPEDEPPKGWTVYKG